MRDFGEMLNEILEEIPMCEVCGMSPAQVTVIRWHNNLRVESDECLSCSHSDIRFNTQSDCYPIPTEVSYRTGEKSC